MRTFAFSTPCSYETHTGSSVTPAMSDREAQHSLLPNLKWFDNGFGKPSPIMGEVRL